MAITELIKATKTPLTLSIILGFMFYLQITYNFFETSLMIYQGILTFSSLGLIILSGWAGYVVFKKIKKAIIDSAIAGALIYFLSNIIPVSVLMLGDLITGKMFSYNIVLSFIMLPLLGVWNILIGACIGAIGGFVAKNIKRNSLPKQ